MARIRNRRAARTSNSGASWISYSDMMAALLLVFVLILSVSLYQYFTMLETKTAELDAQKALVSQQQVTLDAQTLQLASQQVTMDKQATEIAIIQVQLDSQAKELENAYIVLSDQQAQLQQAQTDLADREAKLIILQTDLKNKEMALQAANEVLENQQAAMAAQAEQIDALIGIRPRCPLPCPPRTSAQRWIIPRATLCWTALCSSTRANPKSAQKARRCLTASCPST